MPTLTRYGALFGYPPQATGRVFFVAPAEGYTVNGDTYRASDDNDGLSPERALRTVARAITLATANVGDIIISLEGTHTFTSTLTINKAGLTFLGAGLRWEDDLEILYPTIWAMTGTNDELLNVTASGTELGYLTFRPQNGYSTISFQTTSAIDRLRVHHASIDMTTRCTGGVSVETRGLDFGNRAGGTGMGRIAAVTVAAGNATAYIRNVVFISDGAQGEAVHLATCHMHMKNCRIHNNSGTWASPFAVGTNTDNTLLQDVIFTTSGTMSSGITAFSKYTDTLAADAVTIARCLFGFTADDIDGFTTGQGNAITSYEPASGGTLSTVN